MCVLHLLLAQLLRRPQELRASAGSTAGIYFRNSHTAGVHIYTCAQLAGVPRTCCSVSVVSHADPSAAAPCSCSCRVNSRDDFSNPHTRRLLEGIQIFLHLLRQHDRRGLLALLPEILELEQRGRVNSRDYRRNLQQGSLCKYLEQPLGLRVEGLCLLHDQQQGCTCTRGIHSRDPYVVPR